MQLTVRRDARSDAAVARWAGAAFVALTLALFAATVALDVATDPHGTGARLAPGYGWSYALLGPLLAGLAALILARDQRQGLGWALAWLGCFWSVDGVAQSYVRFGVRADEALAGANLALWVLNRVGAFLPATVAVLLFLFPTGRFVPGAWRVVGWVGTVAMLASALIVVVSPNGKTPGVALPPGVDLDFGALALPEGFSRVAQSTTVAVSVAGLLLAMATVIVRYRRSRGVDRDRMRWLLWSVVAMAFLIAGSFALDVRAVQDLAIFLIMALPAVAMTVAVVDPTLVSIEDLLGRTLVYGVLALVIGGVDLAALALLTTALGDSLEQPQVVTLVLLLTVLLYGPLRLRLSQWVRRLVLGDRANPYDAVAGLASTLETTAEGPDQLAAVARSVASAFGVGFVSVEVDRGGGERLVAAYGDRPVDTRSLPITYRGAPVGRLVLPARGLRSRLSRRDEELLGDLVRQAATAARTSRLAEELQESRERLVAAREEERRRIRRDLHDGLGPALSGVVFQLEGARLLVDRDAERAKGQIGETSRNVQEVVADVRRLVHDLRPPALDDLGLAGALRQQAERLSTDGLCVRVHAGDLGPLPAAAEVAAYRIAAEALTNVVRHAGARSAEVRLDRDCDALLVEVSDDGVGIPPEVQAGVGLLSLRERAAELGGRSEVTCPPAGGTTVRAWLPLVPERVEAGEPA